MPRSTTTWEFTAGAAPKELLEGGIDVEKELEDWVQRTPAARGAWSSWS